MNHSPPDESAEAQELARDLALKAAGIGCWQLSPDGQQVRIDARMAGLLGRPSAPDLISREAFLAHFIPADRELLNQALQACAQARTFPPLTLERTPDSGQPGPTALALRGEPGTPSGGDSQLYGSSWDASRIRELERELERVRMHDELTGLHTRGYFDTQLMREWRISLRERLDLSVVIVQPDCLSSGPQAPQTELKAQLMRRVGGLLGQTLSRPYDLAARYDQERLVMLLPRTDLEGARHLASNLMRAFDEDAQLPELLGADHHARLSLGIGWFGDAATALGHEVLLGRAEAAVRAARRDHGSSIEQWQDHMPEAPIN